MRDKTRLDEFAPSVPALTLTEIVGFCLPYLSIRDCAVLKACSKTLASVAAHHSPEHLAIVKSVLHGSGPSVRVFETYGTCLLSLAVSADSESCMQRRCACPLPGSGVTSQTP